MILTRTLLRCDRCGAEVEVDTDDAVTDIDELLGLRQDLVGAINEATEQESAVQADAVNAATTPGAAVDAPALSAAGALIVAEAAEPGASEPAR